MAFFKNLFGSSKPAPDNAITIYVDELKQMAETLTNLRTQFAQYGRTVQLLSNNGLQLAHTIRQFNVGLKLTNPHVQDFAVSTIHFRDDINKVWSKQYVDEVLGMFDHWNRNAEAQQTTISNYHMARDHCFALKLELDELTDRRQGYLNQKKNVPSDLQNEIVKADEQYKRYSSALENIRSAIISNQTKLLGKNGQLLSFSRAFYALLEAQCNLTSYFGALTDSYAPLLDEYRKELGIIPQPQQQHQLQQMSSIGNGGPSAFGQSLSSDPTNGNFQFKDDITVLDIADFIKQTASLENDRTTLNSLDTILHVFDAGQPELPSQQLNPNNTFTGSTAPSGECQPTSSLTIHTNSDSPHFLPRRGSFQPQGSPTSLTSPSTTVLDPITGQPTLSFSFSTRKKRQTLGPASPGPTDLSLGLSPIAGGVHTGTGKKHSSRVTRDFQNPSTGIQAPIPPFQLDEPNTFQKQLLKQQQAGDSTTISQTDNDLSQQEQKRTDAQVICAFAVDHDDERDLSDFMDEFNDLQIGQSTNNNPNLGSSFQSILERMANEETHLAEPDVSDPTTHLSTQDIELLAQRWSISDLNPRHESRERIIALLSTLNALCTKYIADWLVVEIELQLWAKSPSLQLLLCTLNTLTICKQSQYGFTFRSVSPETSNQYFSYVYNIFTNSLQQLFGQTDHDIIINANKFVDIFASQQGQNETNVQKLVQATQILRLLTILCDKYIVDVTIKRKLEHAQTIDDDRDVQNNNDVDYEDEDLEDEDLIESDEE
jgi:hypothetical protein